jgi:hypothetical protein
MVAITLRLFIRLFYSFTFQCMELAFTCPFHLKSYYRVFYTTNIQKISMRWTAPDNSLPSRYLLFITPVVPPWNLGALTQGH